MKSVGRLALNQQQQIINVPFGGLLVSLSLVLAASASRSFSLILTASSLVAVRIPWSVWDHPRLLVPIASSPPPARSPACMQPHARPPLRASQPPDRFPWSLWPPLRFPFAFLDLRPPLRLPYAFLWPYGFIPTSRSLSLLPMALSPPPLRFQCCLWPQVLFPTCFP